MKRICLLLAASSLLATSGAVADPGADFATLVDEVWEWRLAENPLLASRLGDRRYNTVWRNRSFDAIGARHLQSRDFLRRLYAIGRAQLSESDLLNYELFRRALQNEVDAHQFKAYLMPFSHRGGVQNLDSQADFLRFTSLKDYEDWLERLQEIGTVVSQTIDVADHGRKAGIVSSKILMNRIPDQIAMQLVDNAEDSPFFREVTRTISRIGSIELRVVSACIANRSGCTPIQSLPDAIQPPWRRAKSR